MFSGGQIRNRAVTSGNKVLIHFYHYDLIDTKTREVQYVRAVASNHFWINRSDGGTHYTGREHRVMDDCNTKSVNEEN